MALATLVPPARAQAAPPVAPLAIVGGQMRYSVQETLSDGLVGIRLASPVAPLGTRHWLLEPSLTFAWYRPDGGRRRHLLVPEVQLQVQSGPEPVKPYLGIGGGLGITRIDSTTTVDLTFSASAGVRLRVSQRWGALGEVRFRRFDLFGGWTRELTLGLFAALE